jgi:hypothetical protein
VAPGSVWKGAENLVPTGIRSPDRPARSESLYLLSYPALPRLKNDMNILKDVPAHAKKVGSRGRAPPCLQMEMSGQLYVQATFPGGTIKEEWAG